MSPSLTASLAIIVPTRSQVFDISTSQKSEHATLLYAYCRDLTDYAINNKLCIGVKLRGASGPQIAYRTMRAPPLPLR